MFPSAEPTVVAGCRSLGWLGQVVGPVRFGGIRFWASVDVDQREHARRRSAGLEAITDRRALAGELAAQECERRLQLPIALEGCLVVSEHPGSALNDASLLAGYSSRAVLVPNSNDVLGVLADAALLDQGVVVHAHGTITMLALAGPKVPASIDLQPREWELLETVYEAYLVPAPLTAG